jgi:hypothetical protein
MPEFADLYVRRLIFFKKVWAWLETQSEERLWSLVGTTGVGKSWFIFDLFQQLANHNNFVPIWLDLSQAVEIPIISQQFDIISENGRKQWLTWAGKQAKKRCKNITKPDSSKSFDAAFALFIKELCQHCRGLTPVLLVDGYDDVLSESLRDFLLERTFNTFYKEGCTRLIITRRDDKNLPHHILGWNEQIHLLPSLNDQERETQIAKKERGEETALILAPHLSGNAWTNNFLYHQVISRNPTKLLADDIIDCLHALLERAGLEATQERLMHLQRLTSQLPRRWTARQLRDTLGLRLEDKNNIEPLFEAGFLKHVEGTPLYEIDLDLYFLLQEYHEMTGGTQNG